VCEMKGKLFLLPVMLICFAFRMEAQPVFPEMDPVFTDSIIPRIDILIDPDSLDALFNDVTSYHEYPATFIFRAGNTADTVGEIGFRLRGNTSRFSPKKSFKVSFNTFVPGRRFYGLEKMNINGEHNDPSVIRSKLCWDILRQMGVPGSRANHVELYVNGAYYGLYINVEHIDEEFAFSRFGNRDGNLYKCLWPADLVYFSSNPEDYKFESEGRRAYDLCTNEDVDNYDDLFHFIEILNKTPDGDLPCEIEKIFNVDDFLKVLAFDAACGNWDDYSYLKNNYYLYHNTATGKFEYIPYDLDNTFGIDWFGIDWATRDIYNWKNPDELRPLHSRILAIQKYRDQYSRYLDELAGRIMDTTEFFPRIDSIHAMITPSVENDPFYPLSYGYTVEDFHRSYHESLGSHVVYGLKNFITVRTVSIRASLENNGIVPVINYIVSNHPRLGEPAVVSAFIPFDDPGTGVELEYSIDGGSPETRAMADDGAEPDLVAGDRVFTAASDPVNSSATILFRVRASSQGGSTAEPCEGLEMRVFESASPDLYINEFMAGNLSTRTDEYGEYDDWLEIYNGDVNPVWLGDKYLSDDINEPEKWKLPETVLDPGQFILIWADGQSGQGPNHASFRLSKSGEEIVLFESPGRNSLVIDRLAFGSQQDDVSLGRSTDGGVDWISFTSPTPGFSNLAVFNESTDMPEKTIRVYPNPVSGGIIYFSRPVSVRMYDISGRLLMERENAGEMNVSGFPPGIYLLRFSSGEVEKIVIRDH